MPTPSAPPKCGPRTEWKTTADASTAERWLATARTWLRPDPHGADGTYAVESVYFDTASLLCFRSDGPASLPKYRVRRYGPGSEVVFIEEKLRRGASVWKRRAVLPDCTFEALRVEAPDDAAELAWFRSRLRMLALQPCLLIRYVRHAWVGDGGVRFTVDQALDATPVAPLRPGFEPVGAPRALSEHAVVEIKFEGEPTPLVERLRTLIACTPSAFSKYRHGVLACGAADLLDPERTMTR